MFGYYVIHSASQCGLLTIVQYLIEKQNIYIDIKGYDEMTQLHYACWNDLFPIVQYLISNGADVNAKDVKRKTPLHHAGYNLSNYFKYLISQGANVNATDSAGIKLFSHSSYIVKHYIYKMLI